MVKHEQTEANQVELDKIPVQRLNALCQAILDCTEQIFDDPDEKDRYKGWKRTHWKANR